MISLEVSYTGRNLKVSKEKEIIKVAEKDLADLVVCAHAQFAKKVLKEFQRRDQFPKDDFLTLVDNRVEDQILKVKPFGVIEYRTKLEDLKPALRAAIAFIQERSPERTGAYQANNVLFKNNQFVAKGFSAILSFIEKDTSEITDIYRFVNISPYARKLERYRIRKETQGKRKGLSSKANVKAARVKGKIAVIPAGAYVLASRALKRKYKELRNNIRFSFIPVDPSIARALDSSGKDTPGYVFAKGRADGNGAGRPYLYPSITVTGNENIKSFNRGFTEQAGL